MRGSPLLRALLLLLGLGLFALPLWRLTRPEVASKTTESPESAATVEPLELRATFLPGPPAEFEVRHLGKPVWKVSGAEQAASGPLRLPFPAEGIDLELIGRWPPGQANGAVRLGVVRAGAPVVERVAWTKPDGTLSEVLTFP
ncbi:MAG: hypothetical protein JSR82_03540 [Verrucomicrobia bacterium]|nr:hypothetical protein [Verrucomicrobiota bacterium]